MNIKNALLSTLIFLYPLQLCGMEQQTATSKENGSKSPKRVSENDTTSSAPNKRLCTKSPQQTNSKAVTQPLLSPLHSKGNNSQEGVNNGFTRTHSEGSFCSSPNRSAENIALPVSSDKQPETKSPQNSQPLLFPEHANQGDPLAHLLESEKQKTESIPIVVVSSDSNLNANIPTPSFSASIKQTIYDLDLITFGQLLVSNNATQLTKEEKEILHKCAKDQKTLFEAINDFVKQTESQEIKTKYSSDSEYQNIQKISRHLYAFKTLPKLTFPQYFSPNIPYTLNTSPKTTPDKALLALIKNEQKKISVCCYSFDYMPIAQALVRKKKDGVFVEVITDKEQGQKTKALEVIKLLEENGIEVLAPQNDKWESMHHKFSLFSKNLLDKPLVCEGSFNYTDSATKRNWEFMETSDTPEKIEFFKNEFTTVQSRSKKLPTIQPVQQRNNNYQNNNQQRRYS